MTMSTDYTAQLQNTFKEYCRNRYPQQAHLFELRPKGGPVVFHRTYSSKNILVPPTNLAGDAEQQRIVAMILPKQRHLHFSSMRSSQALAQSVFGTIWVLNRLPLLSSVLSEDERPAFGPALGSSSLQLEKTINDLGEPRPTSVDVWIEGPYRVAVECKLAESEFGQCSRPRLTENDPAFEKQHCDGSYTMQRGRTERCSLTQIGVHYWRYLDALFGWHFDVDQRPCPLHFTYQLIRNALAACVKDEKLDPAYGHALIIYDERNPTMWPGGVGSSQWERATETVKEPGVLRRLSWQAFIRQWPHDGVLNWLKVELGAKYGLVSQVG